MKLRHRTRGECELWGEFTTYINLRDQDGNVFQAQWFEIVREDEESKVVPIKKEPLIRVLNDAQPPTGNQQVYINYVNAEELRSAVPLLSEADAKAIVSNKPKKGYTDFHQLTRLNLEVAPELLKQIGELGLFIFEKPHG